jgi:hypothetical protein
MAILPIPSGLVRLQAGRAHDNTTSHDHAPSPLSPWPGPPGSTRSYHTMIKATGLVCKLDSTKIRLIRTRDGKPGLNYLCTGLQKFWHHIDEDARDTASAWLKESPCARLDYGAFKAPIVSVIAN